MGLPELAEGGTVESRGMISVSAEEEPEGCEAIMAADRKANNAAICVAETEDGAEAVK